MTELASRPSPTSAAAPASGETAEQAEERRIADGILGRIRAAIHGRPRLRRWYRAAVATIGGLVVIVGLILVPLPGPGWLIVFAGLAVLGTEFHWARRINARLKALLARFWRWWRARRERTRTPSRD